MDEKVKSMKQEPNIIEILNSMDPKIKKVLKNTKPQERENLEQEIKLKILESVERNSFEDTPGFWDFLKKFE